jgi:hypothetical protein
MVSVVSVLVVAALALALAIALATALAFVASDRRTQASAQGGLSRPIKVVVIGYSNAGKTVFLASMFHRFLVPDRAGVFLDTDTGLRGRLLAQYRELADAGASFPSATAPGDIMEWPFRVWIRAARPVEVMRFTYLDFSGERCDELFSPDLSAIAEQLEERIAGADVLMAMLDGAQVLRLMEGPVEQSFYARTKTLVSLLAKHPRPMHLILTKWDLFEARGYTLDSVVERLVAIEFFGALVEGQRRQNVALRLIPVSSVGMEFAYEEDGVMKKRLGKEVDPFQVEMPLACTLPDVISAAAGPIVGGNGRRARDLARLKQALRRVRLSVNLGPLQIAMLAQAEQRPTDGEPRQLVMPGWSSNDRTVAQAYGHFLSLVKKLERDFPASNLSMRGSGTS